MKFISSSNHAYAYVVALVVLFFTCEQQVVAVRCYTNNFNNWTALPNSTVTEIECGPLEQCAAIKFQVRNVIT